jgi:hypothetical protein
LTTFVIDWGDHEDIVTLGFEQTAELADVGGSAIVVVEEDVQSCGAGGQCR